MRRLYHLFFLLCLLSGLKQEMHAQSFCATDELHRHLLRANPEYKKAVELQAAKWQKYSKEIAGTVNRPGIANDSFYEIPVVIHVIHSGQPYGSYNNPSEDELIAMIAKLNSVFAGTYNDGTINTTGSVNIPIRFKLAQRTPNCGSMGVINGINRVDGSILPEYREYGVYYNGEKHGPYDAEVKALSRWPYDSYMNIWIVTQIYGSVQGGGGIAGYATYPGVSSPELDGIVVVNTGIDILAHEVGHYLSLRHTFEGNGDGNTCPPNNDCTIDGDQVCDTEPHYAFGCNTGINPCTNQPWGPVVRNFMNYYSCQGIFSPGQRDKMVYALKELRGNLLTSLGGLHLGISPDLSAIPTASCLPAGIVHSGYDMGPFTVKLADMHVNTRGNLGDNNQYYVDHTPLSCIQSQPVAHLDKGGTYTLTVTTEVAPQNVRGWIDFNNDGIFQTAERIMNSHGTKDYQTHTSSFTVASAGVVTCPSLRMRIISDAADEAAPQPCSTLMYGQAEDFIVIVKEPSFVVPSLTIAANTTNQICHGTNVTFTATPTNGGSNPDYQWQKNGIDIGANVATYSDNELSDGDVISCRIRDIQGVCSAYWLTASNVITMSVSPTPVLVSIMATPGNMVCEGTNVIFKALPNNGGSKPAYQWKKNGTNIGTNTNTYSSNSLANGDTISCVMTILETCPAAQTVVSNPITMKVSIPPDGVSVTPPPVAACIPESNNARPCCGIDINNVKLADLDYWTFENSNYTDLTLPAPTTCFPLITHLNSGDTYAITVTTSYDIANVRGWIDFNNDGVFQATELILSSDGTSTYQTHTSSFTVPSAGITACTSLRMRIVSGTARGNPIPPPPEPCSILPNGGMVVDFTVIITDPGILVPTVSITRSSSYICEGQNATFTAIPVNGGINPTFYWRLNGLHVGTNSDTYSSGTLKGENEVICIMTSSELNTCNPTVTSGSSSIWAYPNVTPTIGIRSDASGPICAGTNVNFWADYTHGGLPSFEWKVNGIRVGSSYNSYYFTSTLKNGDVVTCELNSAEPCATIRKAKSNAIVMEVLGPMPSVTICGNTNGTFTATAVNFNPNLTYQWKLNGANVGANNATYTNNALGDGTISCDITGSTACASLMTATSNRISITSDTIAAPEIYVYPDRGNTICTGTSVTFTAIPVNGGINPKYQWKVGNTLVGTNSPTFTMANPTNGTVVTCTLTSNASCSNLKTVTSQEVTISAIAPPLANVAAAGPLSFCAGKNVLLKAITGAGYTYQWKKAGINIDNATTSNYTATAAGAYSVVITNAAGCSATSVVMNATVNNVPLATVAAAGPLTFCAGKTVQLKAITGTGYTYQWKRGGADIAGATLSNYTASTNGIYNVVVTNASGCSSTSTAFNVFVKPLPLATITAAGPTSFCSDKSVLLKANTGTNYTYQWIRGAAPITGAVQSNFSATLPGLYTVIVTNASGCSVTSAAIAVSVNPLPVASITPVGSLTFCTGQSVLLRANTGTNYTYQWKKAGVNIANATQVNYTAIVSGQYTVVVTNAAGCAVTSAAVIVTVNNAPLANLAAAGATTFCAGKSVLLKAITGTGYTYQWKKNNINIPNEIASTYAATATGNYSVVVSNAAGCSTASTTISVAVTAAPLATVAVAGPTTFCEGKTVLLKAITGTGYIYQWRKSGINIPLQTQSNYTATATGVYTVMVTNTEGCSTLSTAINVTVTPAPSAIITASGPLIFTQGGNVILNVPAATDNTYQWKKEGVNIAGATTENYTATASGSYVVAITNAGGCQAVSQPTVVTVTQTRPITKGYVEESEKITVSPNPLYRNDYVNIDWNISNVGNGIFVTVYDMTGRKINSQRLKPGDGRVRITGASGVYVVELRWGVDKRKTFKVIKIE